MMSRLVLGDRGSGRTTRAIELADVLDGTIVVHDQREAVRLIRDGIKPERLLTYDMLLRGDLRGVQVRPVVIDNLDYLVQRICGIHLFAAGTWGTPMQIDFLDIPKGGEGR